jgi:hypothetical protein
LHYGTKLESLFAYVTPAHMLITRKNPIRIARLMVEEPATHELLFGRPLTAIEYTRCPPPDEATVVQLNAIAGAHPFCRIHKAKRHDTL